MKSRTILLIGGIVLGTGLSVWYASREALPVRQEAKSTPAITVSSVTAIRRDVPISLQANGTVTPLSNVELHPQTTSTVKQVHIKEGQFVQVGELLFTLDDRVDAANLEKAQAQIGRDKALLADLERQYKRSQELAAQKFIAQSAADTVRSQTEAQRALIESDEAAIRSAALARRYNSIHAPEAGRVGAINVYPGSLVQPATALATVTMIDPIAVSFSLPESSLHALLDAQKAGPVAVQVNFPGSVKAIKGALSFIDNMVDPQGGTIRVKAKFDNHDTSLWPGQYVNVGIAVQTIKDAVVVPQAAIVTNTSGTFVYSVEADQTARSRPVTVLHGFGPDAAVSGLSGGEKIIIEGKQNLRPGARVSETQQTSDGKDHKRPESAASEKKGGKGSSK